MNLGSDYRNWYIFLGGQIALSSIKEEVQYNKAIPILLVGTPTTSSINISIVAFVVSIWNMEVVVDGSDISLKPCIVFSPDLHGHFVHGLIDQGSAALRLI